MSHNYILHLKSSKTVPFFTLSEIHATLSHRLKQVPNVHPCMFSLRFSRGWPFLASVCVQEDRFAHDRYAQTSLRN